MKQETNCGALRILETNGLNYEVTNNRVTVTHNGLTADFYRDTGKFLLRGDDVIYENIKLLVKILRGDYNQRQFSHLREQYIR